MKVEHVNLSTVITLTPEEAGRFKRILGDYLDEYEGMREETGKTVDLAVALNVALD